MNRKDKTEEYQLIDSGRGMKLERVGPYLLCRPSPQAVWPPSLPQERWRKADAVYIRSSSGGGRWDFKIDMPESWEIEYRGFRFRIKPTGFGHLGIFPEHGESWEWISKTIAGAKRELNLLNLFAYTGGSTLAAAAAAASVCHVDSSKGVVDWARVNAELSGLGSMPVRWIVDDVNKFINKEIRRGKKYDALILDPPSFGRGAKGEVWKIEDQLAGLLTQCRELLTADPAFLLLSCHSPGFTPIVLHNLLKIVMKDKKGKSSCGEMTLPDESREFPLPSGCFARWSSL
ncbi:MAG: class I SAM-dependent methyltransferase [Nitrospirae bacterium]|nr:class I SAM-dependent methyltransferase [Nitrospirota bacterium]